MLSKVGKFDLVAEPFHVDFTSRLSLGVLGNHLLNCAGFHASERGFGIGDLNEHHYTWVVSRLSIEMSDMPRAYQSFSVKTWIERVYRLFTDRNFEITDADGKPLGYARSVWAMIDLDTRRPADLLSLHGGTISQWVCERSCPIEKPGRLRAACDRPIGSHKVTYSDIDINGHVNSIRYIEHILDCYPLDRFEVGRGVRRFEIAYITESYFGDSLCFFSRPSADGGDEIEVRKGNGETVVRSRIVFN